MLVRGSVNDLDRPHIIAKRRFACKPAHQALSNAAIFVGTVRQKLVITEWHHP
jgi:hypothetical protein